MFRPPEFPGVIARSARHPYSKTIASLFPFLLKDFRRAAEKKFSHAPMREAAFRTTVSDLTQQCRTR
jgi:hypothetical protein